MVEKRRKRKSVRLYSEKERPRGNIAGENILLAKTKDKRGCPVW